MENRINLSEIDAKAYEAMIGLEKYLAQSGLEVFAYLKFFKPHPLAFIIYKAKPIAIQFITTDGIYKSTIYEKTNCISCYDYL